MTTWRIAGNFPYPHDSLVTLVINAAEVHVFNKGREVHYCVRYREDGKPVWTEQRKIGDSSDPTPVNAYIQAPNGHVFVGCGPNRWWIPQDEIPEVNPAPPPPPPPPPQKLIPELHGHFLSFWQQFYLEAWEARNEYATLTWARETVTEARSYGTSLLDGFLFLSDGTAEHALWNKKTPWVFRDGKFDLSQPNPRFWEIYRRFLELFRDHGHGMRWAPQLAMAFRYNLWPFNNNHQGIRVTHIWDRPTWPYLRQIGRLCCEAHRNVFGPDNKPWVKIMNEAGHGGNGHLFHEIMYCHENVFKQALADFMPLENLIVDTSHCDGAQGELIDLWKCVKQGDCDKPDFMHGTAEYKRRRIPESHGYSTLADYTTPFAGRSDGKNALDVFLGSGNPRWRPTEDGASWTKTGKGVKWGPYQIATAEQTYEMARHVLSAVKKKGKQIYIGLFPLETLGASGYPHYQKEWIDWTRFAAFRRAREEVYG